MSTTDKTIAYILDQAAGAGGVSARKMFGEYAVYLEGRMIALVCDDQLYVKPTPEGRALAAGAPEAAPFPKAKPHLLIDGDRLEDADALAALLRVTASALPPAPQKPPAKARRSR